jgi:alkanesulfonate monooxygenase SsuD/methylene tetrahydromethanopterin reductase-like flavin-dependent oxidoreductase (luciferase family)
MGVGSGYLSHEFEGFGTDVSEKRERFDSSIDVIRRAWAGERVEHEHAWFSTRGAQLKVLPVQRPSPPIYVAVLRREAAYHVGRRGDRVMAVPYATVDAMDDIGALLAEYRAGLSEGGHTEPQDAALVALHAHVAATDEEARAQAARAFDLYVQTRLYTRHQEYDDILRSRLALFGSVETVSDQLVELHDLGLRHVMLMMNFGGLEQRHVQGSMRLMVDEVAPRVAARIAPE